MSQPPREAGQTPVVWRVAVSWHRQTPSHPGLCQQRQLVGKQAGTVSPRGNFMSVSSPGRDLFTYSGGWHEFGNLLCQVVPRSASLLREGTMGWAVFLLSLKSCAYLGRLLHLSVPKSMRNTHTHTPDNHIMGEDQDNPEVSHSDPASSQIVYSPVENWSHLGVTKYPPQLSMRRAD